MTDTSPVPRRFSIRVPPRLWLGAMAIGLALLGVCIGLAIYPTSGLGRSAENRELSTESPVHGIRAQAAESLAHHAPRSRSANREDDCDGFDDPPVSVRLVASAPPESPSLSVVGQTRCRSSRRGVIAPAIFRPVVEVLVTPGERVTKGQVLIKLYDLEAQAKVRIREMELKSIESKAQSNRRNLERAELMPNTGIIPFSTLNDLRATSSSNEALVLAAEAELSLAQSELKLYSLTAAIDGEISWLDISPGAVAWPGSMTWGEIVDLRELDIRCELTPIQTDQVAVGQSAEVWLADKEAASVTGNVVFVGKSADRHSGLIPVTVRMDNTEERFRAEIIVNVRFQPIKEK